MVGVKLPCPYLPLLLVNAIGLAVRKGLEEALLKKVIKLQILTTTTTGSVKKTLGKTDLVSSLRVL